MIKKCTNCAKKLIVDAKFCHSCGATVKTPEGTLTNKNINDDTSQTATNTTTETTSLKKQNDNILSKIIHHKTIAIISSVTVILIALFITLAFNAYKRPVKYFFNAIEKTDIDDFKKSVPEEMTKYLENDEINYKLEDLKKSLEDKYGNEIKINADIIDKIKTDKQKQKYLAESYNLDLKKAYDLCVRITINGNDKKEKFFLILTVSKIDDKWVIVNSDNVISNLT